MNFLQPKDILERLFRRKPNWYHGVPSYHVYGVEKQFGFLVFDFKDEVVSFKVYLYNKKEIEDVIEHALANHLILGLELFANGRI